MSARKNVHYFLKVNNTAKQVDGVCVCVCVYCIYNELVNMI
jgi:hypothetical protein